MEDRLNKDYEVLTPSGWKNFYGIRKSSGRDNHKIITNTTKLVCSKNHKILTESGYKYACDLKPNEKIISNDGLEQLQSLSLLRDNSIDLYDLLEVDTHEYYTNGLVSHNCEFIGSQNTLIDPNKLKCLAYKKPLRKRDDGLIMYEEPIPNHTYFMAVDVSRGKEIDYHAFTVIDVTETPYKICAVFRNNELSPMLLPTVVNAIGKTYNKAWCLVEINDIGGQVADMLYHELEYENILLTSIRGRKGQTLDAGFGNFQTQLGVRTSPAVKKLGCAILKDMIESDKILIEDYNCIEELTAFVVKRNSFEAETGYHDDLVMTLVLFSWATTFEYFKDLTDLDIRSRLYDDKIKQIEEDLVPFGFISDGADEETFVDNEGNRWSTANDMNDPTMGW